MLLSQPPLHLDLLIGIAYSLSFILTENSCKIKLAQILNFFVNENFERSKEDVSQRTAWLPRHYSSRRPLIHLVGFMEVGYRVRVLDNLSLNQEVLRCIHRYLVFLFHHHCTTKSFDVVISFLH